MYKSYSKHQQTSLFWDLETMLDSKHPLFKLANLVDWVMFEKSFSPLYCQDNGRPAKPISLLPILLWHGFLLDQGSMCADRTCRIQTSYRREGHRALS